MKTPSLFSFVLKACTALLLLSAGSLSGHPALAAAAPDKSNPTHALYLMQKGIDDRDPDTFNLGADVGRIADGLADAFAEAVQERSISDKDGAGMQALFEPAKNPETWRFVKPLLVSEARTFVSKGIRSGVFSGTEDAETDGSGISSGLVSAGVTPGRRQFVPGKLISQKDNTARMRAVLVDPDVGRVNLDLALERRGEQWRVVEVRNSRELIDEALRRNR